MSLAHVRIFDDAMDRADSAALSIRGYTRRALHKDERGITETMAMEAGVLADRLEAIVQEFGLDTEQLP